MKNNKLLTFLFAFIPGTGQMYLGFMKRGISIMLLLFITIFLSPFLNIISFLVFIIWFAAFFDTFHIAAKLRTGELMSDDFICLKDKDLQDLFQVHKLKFDGKIPKYVGVAVLSIGIYSLLNQFYYDLYSFLLKYSDTAASILSSIWHGLPQLVVSIIIIIIGIKLVKAPKKTVSDDIVEYKIDSEQSKESN